MAEVTLYLDPESKTPFFVQVYQYIRDRILDGEIPPGTRLPSIRKSAIDLQINKNTIESAYQQLLAEGYIASKPKSGYYVLPIHGEYGENASLHELTVRKTSPFVSMYTHNFRYGTIETADFPFSIWHKLQSEYINQHRKSIALDAHPTGESGLRKELAAYLLQTRGISCTPDQIVIGSGVQQLVTVLCQLLHREYRSIAFEDPGYDGARNTFSNFGFEMSALPLLTDGLDIGSLIDSAARVVYVNPSHQFVSRMVMPVSKRLALLQWAYQHNCLIIEDDFEGEFRYTGKPVPAIAALDSQQHVIYLGTISKSLLPLFHISYLVLPERFVKLFKDTFPIYEQPVSRINQKTLQLFMERGYWAKHVKKMRNVFAKKHGAILEAIKLHMGNRIRVRGKDTGLHVLVEIDTIYSEKELIKLAQQKKIRVYPTTRFWSAPQQTSHPTLLLGFGGLTENEINEGIELLSHAWFSE